MPARLHMAKACMQGRWVSSRYSTHPADVESSGVEQEVDEGISQLHDFVWRRSLTGAKLVRNETHVVESRTGAGTSMVRIANCKLTKVLTEHLPQISRKSDEAQQAEAREFVLSHVMDALEQHKTASLRRLLSLVMLIMQVPVRSVACTFCVLHCR